MQMSKTKNLMNMTSRCHIRNSDVCLAENDPLLLSLTASTATHRRLLSMQDWTITK